MGITERLKSFRKSLGLSQQAIAQKIGMPMRTYQYLEGKEDAKISVITIKALANLGCDPTWLFLGDASGLEADKSSSGQAVIDLPEHAPRPLEASEKDLLERTLTVLRSPGAVGDPDQALVQNIHAFYGSVTAQGVAGPTSANAPGGGGEPGAGDEPSPAGKRAAGGAK